MVWIWLRERLGLFWGLHWHTFLSFYFGQSVSVVTYYGRERTALQQYISLFLSKSTLSLESGGFCSLRGTVFTLSTRALKIETFRMAGRHRTRKSRVKMGMHSLARHFFITCRPILTLPVQPSCCVRSWMPGWSYLWSACACFKINTFQSGDLRGTSRYSSYFR